MATILDPFPRVTLASLPTPLEPLPRLSAFLGGPQILVKRDDQTGLAMGGNKVRKLEYLVGHARTLGCDTLVTIGGLQSNHARQTAAAAARLGMECELVLPRMFRDPARSTNNQATCCSVPGSVSSQRASVVRCLTAAVGARQLGPSLCERGCSTLNCRL